MTNVSKTLIIIFLSGFALITSCSDRNSKNQRDLKNTSEIIPSVTGEWSLSFVTYETWRDTVLCKSNKEHGYEDLKFTESEVYFLNFPFMLRNRSNYIQRDSFIYFNDGSTTHENKIIKSTPDTLILLNQSFPRNHWSEWCNGKVTKEKAYFVYTKTEFNSDTLNILLKDVFNRNFLSKTWYYERTSLNVIFARAGQMMLTTSIVSPYDTISSAKYGKPVDNFIDFKPEYSLDLTDTSQYRINGSILSILTKNENYKVEFLSDQTLLLTPFDHCSCDTLMLLYRCEN